jgi:hypothetical protein
MGGWRSAAAGEAGWTVGEGYRWRALTFVEGSRVGFSNLPPAVTGVKFVNTLPESRHLTNQILLNGAGLAAGDVDGDGWCDLYLCCSEGVNALYRNLGGWKFQEVPGAGGAACSGLTSTGAALADLDGDGDLDLIVNTVARGTRLFFNDGRGQFTPAEVPLNEGRGGMSLSLADVDGDGLLDLYVANYRSSALMDIPNARATFRTVDGRTELETFNGRPVTEPDLVDRFRVGPRGAIEERGEPDVLYRNLGGGRFAPIPFTEGAFLDEEGRPLAHSPLDWALSVMFRDLNQDLLPDLYVCNDFQTEDRLWINQGGGRFRLAPRLALRRTSLFSMAVDFADLNRDGLDDMLVLDMMSREHAQRMRYVGDAPPLPEVVRGLSERPQYGQNVLFINQGDFTFTELAQFAGLEASEWSWSCVLLDVDLDGFEDVLISNGMERAARDRDVVDRLKAFRAARGRSDAEVFQARRMFPRLATPNLAFRNNGDLTFTEIGAPWGFHAAGISQAMAVADLDNDGDLDVVINNLNSPAGLYRNEAGGPRVAVRLKGIPPNTKGVGARITVHDGAVPAQSQEMIAGGRYLAADDPLRVFAAGSATNVMTLEVRWRSGRLSRIPGVSANRLYEIDEPSVPSLSPPPSPRAPAPPWFADVSDRLGHRHHEEPFDDYVRQPLLPHQLSALGPGVAWVDLDGDATDELVIGSGKGGRLAAYRYRDSGPWERLAGGTFDQLTTRDITGLVAWPAPTNRVALIHGLASYEDGLETGTAVRATVLGDREQVLWPATSSSVGPLAMADIDGDGDLDLFVGGRVRAGKYPMGAHSWLLKNQQGKFAPDPRNSRLLESLGLVSAAVFTDLDQDGDPDLVVACDWGPVRILVNEAGVFSEATSAWGLDAYAGWWNSVVAGDFDGDGRMDLAAGNWGRNTKYQAHRHQPLLAYVGDFNQDGLLDLVEAHHDLGLKKLVPERPLDELSSSLPFLRGRFPSHRAYSTAGMEEVLGDRLSAATVFRANCLESMVFLNRGGRFEARALPAEAQFAPAFGLCVADADGDGNEDLFLAQNFFAVQPGTARYDGGRGLWLRGDGQGTFAAVSALVSGVAVYGEQRGAAVGDFDQDGRPDLVVAQNGEQTRVFRNASGAAGLRVTLRGGPENARGVGAAVRLRFADRWGPVREVRSGSGYWSQDSLTLTMASPAQPERLHVRWPGGAETSTPVPAGARELEVDPNGAATSGAGPGERGKGG